MSLGAVLARSGNGHTSEIAEKGLDVAAAFHVEFGLRTALDWLPHSKLGGQPLAERCVNSNTSTVELESDLSSSAADREAKTKQGGLGRGPRRHRRSGGCSE